MLEQQLKSRIEEMLGAQITHVRLVQRGYTPALRWVMRMADGRRCFAKIATNDMTANWLRLEQHAYSTLNADFMPRMLGWQDDAANPILLLEDLSDAVWPPPWSQQHLSALMRTLDQMWSTPATTFPSAVDTNAGILHGWNTVREDPAPFLGLGLASQTWLDEHLPELCAQDEDATLPGDDLLHGDLRSDNLCIKGDRAIVFDWNNAVRGNRRFDLAALLPSIASEGGPLPETFMPDAGVLSVIMAGYFAARAGLPIIPQAPRVREVQLSQLRHALPWMCRALKLPVPK